MKYVTFIDCKFVNNVKKGTIASPTAIVLLMESKEITFISCEFSDNVGTPITSVDSTFNGILSGSNTLSNLRRLC